ncbi:MAG: GNAT family protein [Pseudomonadota bacterium]
MLKGNKIRFKPLEDDDWENVYNSLENTDEFNFYNPNCMYPETLKNFKDHFEDKIKNHEMHLWKILDFENNYVGHIVIASINQQLKSCEFGIIIKKDQRHKGYAQDAIITLFKFIFGHMAMNRVSATTICLNEPVIKLNKELGMKQEGKIRKAWRYGDKFYDQLLFGMLKEEFYKKYPQELTLPY